MLKVSGDIHIRRKIIKNLLTAQQRSADKGDAKATIRLAKYLLHLLQKNEDVFVQIRTEDDLV